MSSRPGRRPPRWRRCATSPARPTGPWSATACASSSSRARLGERGRGLDRELLLCAALLHDSVPILEGARTGALRQRRQAPGRRHAGSFGWEEDRLHRCLDAIELHHRLTPQSARGAEVELLRRADLIDLVSAGTGNRWLRGLAAAVPRDGVYREVGGIVLREALAGRLAPIFWVRPEAEPSV